MTRLADALNWVADNPATTALVAALLMLASYFAVALFGTATVEEWINLLIGETA